MTENQTTQPAEVIIELKLPVSAVNIIFEGLDGLPHKVSRRVIDELMRQAQAQAPKQPPVQE